MGELSGRVAVVTGAGGGMGRVFAHRLAELGADVAVLDVDLEAGRRNGEDLGPYGVVGEVRALGVWGFGVEADLADPAAAAAAVERVTGEFGRIDVLVNNAGGAITPVERSTASRSPETDVRRLLDVNFATTVNCCRAAAPHLSRRGGAVVNVITAGVARSDRAGRLAIYAAAKSAVLTYSRYLAVELGPAGVRVNCVAPGIIRTARILATAAARGIGEAGQAEGVPLRRLGEPGDVAGVVAFLAGDASAYVTGQVIGIDGGATLCS